MSNQARPIDWQCAHCGSSDANQFTRDGHSRRSLETCMDYRLHDMALHATS